MNITVEKTKPLRGIITIPSDKSISHRAAMFASLTGGRVVIRNFSNGADCHSTLNIVRLLGCEVQTPSEQVVVIDAANAYKNKNENYMLDCGNSGTTMRLFSGIIAPLEGLNATLTGDLSLSRRPMKRIILPLELMGAKIKHNAFKAPLLIKGAELFPVDYRSPVASAQVKSCVLLAGLNTVGKTTVTEEYVSRNHTERMLAYLGADIEVNGTSVSVKKSSLEPKDIDVCGDISSAAFFMAAASIVPDSDIVIKNIGLNPTRTGIIDVLTKMGADIEILEQKTVCNEEVGDIRVKYSNLKGITIEGEIIPRLIDEIPIIAVLATQADGTTTIKDAQDLRNKESDRIKCLVAELKKTGAIVEETPDCMVIEGKITPRGGCCTECYHDHRIAMSLYVLGLVSESPLTVNEFQWVDISFPEFLKLVTELTDY